MSLWAVTTSFKKARIIMIYEKEMFHYLFLHFPIALFCTAFIFELISLINEKKIYATFVLWNIGMAIFWSIFSIIS